MRDHARSALLSGMLLSNGSYREYESKQCHARFTLQQLYPTFASAAVEWNEMGKISPWYSVLTGFAKPGEAVSEGRKTTFYATGTKHVEYVLADVRKTERKPPSWRPSSVLDFGCGLGRLAFAFARLGADVACVDQSVHHLRLAEQEWTVRRGEQDGAISFLPSTPDLLAALSGRRFELVHSIIAMQHMISPLQTAYLEQLCDALADGGIGWIHVPTSDKGGFDNATTRARSCALGVEATNGMQHHYTAAKFLVRSAMSRGCVAAATPTQRGSHAPGKGPKGRNETILRLRLK